MLDDPASDICQFQDQGFIGTHPCQVLYLLAERAVASTCEGAEGTLVHMSYSKEMVGDPQVVTTSPLPPSVSPAIPLPGSLTPTAMLGVE